MKISTYLIIICIIVALFSCETTEIIDYDYYYGGDKIAVHGVISKQEGVRVQINKTVPPNHITKNSFLIGATIILFENDMFVTKLCEIDTGLFISPNNLEINENSLYHIEIIAEGFAKVKSAKQMIKNAAKISSAYYTIDTITPAYRYYYVTFRDPKNSQDGYAYRVSKYYNGTDYSSAVYNEFINPYDFFSDKLFNGNEYTISNRFSPYNNSFDSAVLYDSICIKLYSLSPDFSKYLQSIKEYESTLGDPWFETPSVVYSNMENGCGVFLSYAINSASIKLNPK